MTSEAELPLEGVGARLLRAREAAGLSRAQIAASTKIPERHLVAIEAGDFAALPARTYAVGFSRSYARALGLDENSVAEGVRAELAEIEPEAPRRTIQTFEPGDPARVPSARFAWLSALAALVLVLAGLAWWGGLFAPGGELPSTLPEETPAPSGATSLPASAPAAAGPVVFTATEPEVWVKFTDGADNQLFQKVLAQGETYIVPADAADIRLTTARPDALTITIAGQPVAKLAETQQVMRGVPVSAAALRARGNPAAVAATPTGAVSPVTAIPAPVSRPDTAQRQPKAAAPVRRERTVAPAPQPAAVSPPPVEAIPAFNPAPEPAAAANPTADR